jgi:hypothetical protein
MSLVPSLCHSEAKCRYAEFPKQVIDAECHMLSVIMLGIKINSFIPSVKDILCSIVSLLSLILMPYGISIECHYIKCHYADCHILLLLS